MPRDTLTYLDEMLDACRLATEFVGELTLDELERDTKTLYATVRTLEILGEAARQLPADFRDRETGLPWREIIGMRNVLIHAYFGVDAETVLRTVREDVPALEAALVAMRARIGGAG